MYRVQANGAHEVLLHHMVGGIVYWSDYKKVMKTYARSVEANGNNCVMKTANTDVP